MSLEHINLKLQEGVKLSNTFGIITKITATTIEITGLRPSIGDIVRIVAKDKSKNGLGMVTQIRQMALISAHLALLRDLG